MSDWFQDNIQLVGGLALVAVVVLSIVVRRGKRGMLDRAVHNVENGITADTSGDAAIDTAIMSQSVELHFDAPVERVAQVLGGVKLPFMLERLGDQAWGDRKTVEESQSYGRLEATATGCRARMLRFADANGLTPVEPDWRKLRERLAKAATAAGIAVTQVQGPRMNRVPIGAMPAHLRPEQAGLAPHRWQSADA